MSRALDRFRIAQGADAAAEMDFETAPSLIDSGFYDDPSETNASASDEYRRETCGCPACVTFRHGVSA